MNRNWYLWDGSTARPHACRDLLRLVGRSDDAAIRTDCQGFDPAVMPAIGADFGPTTEVPYLHVAMHTAARQPRAIFAFGRRPCKFLFVCFADGRCARLLLLVALLLGQSTLVGFALQGMTCPDETERRAADQARKEAERSLYFNRINLAQQYWVGDNLPQSRRMLDACPAELRGWEWRYLDRLHHGDLLTLPGNGQFTRSLSFSLLHVRAADLRENADFLNAGSAPRSGATLHHPTHQRFRVQANRGSLRTALAAFEKTQNKRGRLGETVGRLPIWPVRFAAGNGRRWPNPTNASSGGTATRAPASASAWPPASCARHAARARPSSSP